MKILVSLIGAALLTSSAVGQVTALFLDASHLDDLARKESGVGSGDGFAYAVESVDGNSIFGSGDALRIADLTANDKPEAIWSKSAMTAGFRLDLSAYNNMHVTDSPIDINFRLGNAVGDLGSKDKVMGTISFEADSKLKVDGSTFFTFTEGVPANVSLVFNVSHGSSLAFTLFDGSYNLAANSVAVFVDGSYLGDKEFVDSTADDPTPNTLSFDPTTGVAAFGFVGESDSKKDVDYLFDNIVLYEGDDISVPISAVPEPSSFALLFGFAALGFASRRRRVAVG